MYATALYKASPVRLQELLLSVRSKVYGMLREDATFRRLLEDARQRQYWNGGQLDQWRNERLRAMLRHAEEAVPYYRSNQSNRNNHSNHNNRCDHSDCSEHSRSATWCNPDDGAAAMLSRFPLLDRKPLLAQPKTFLAQDIPWWRRLSHQSSGSSGNPVTLFHTLDAIRHEHAFVWRQMDWAGYSAGERRVWLRGDLIVPTACEKLPYWRFSRTENMLMMSSYHLGEQSAQTYLAALRRFDPVMIQAYPSSIGFLANWLWHRGQTARLDSLKAVITSSENLTSDMRERIAAVFGARVYDWYGAAERVAAIGTCEHGRYHVIEDYAVMEFMPTADGATEIVGTTLHNDLMPLIRYRTGDVVELEAPGSSCRCGRAFRLVKRIQGRDMDYLVGPGGRIIPMPDFCYFGLTGILEGQIVQEETDRIEIRVVPAGGGKLSAATKRQLAVNMRERVGAGIDIDVVEAGRLPRTRNGKLRPVVRTVG